MPYDAHITEREFLSIEDSLIDYADTDWPALYDAIQADSFDTYLADGWQQPQPLFTDPNVITDEIPF